MLTSVLNWAILLLENALAMLSKKTATNSETEYQLNVWKNVHAMTNVQLVNTACVRHIVHHPILKNVKFFGNMKILNVSRIVMIQEHNSSMIARLVVMANPSALMSAS